MFLSVEIPLHIKNVTFRTVDWIEVASGVQGASSLLWWECWWGGGCNIIGYLSFSSKQLILLPDLCNKPFRDVSCVQLMELRS